MTPNKTIKMKINDKCIQKKQHYQSGSTVRHNEKNHIQTTAFNLVVTILFLKM